MSTAEHQASGAAKPAGSQQHSLTDKDPGVPGSRGRRSRSASQERPVGRERQNPLAFIGGYTIPGLEKLAGLRFATVVGLAIVVITCGLAFTAGTAMAHKVFDVELPQALLFGGVWSTMVLVLDMLIMRQPLQTWISRWGRLGAGVGTALTLLLRGGLAMFTALLVAEPLTLSMVDDAIQRQIAVTNVDRLEAFRVVAYERMVETSQKAWAEAVQAQQVVIDKEQLSRQAQDAVNLEFTQGSPDCPSNPGVQGAGPCTKAKAELYVNAQKAVREAEDRCKLIVDGASDSASGVRAQLTQAQNQADGEVSAYENTLKLQQYAVRASALAAIFTVADGGEPASALKGLKSGETPASARDGLVRAVQELQQSIPSCSAPARPSQTSAGEQQQLQSALDQATSIITGLRTKQPDLVQAQRFTAVALTKDEAGDIKKRYWVLFMGMLLMDLLPLSVKLLHLRTGSALRVHTHDMSTRADLAADDVASRARIEQAIQSDRDSRQAREVAGWPAKQAWIGVRTHTTLLQRQRFRAWWRGQPLTPGPSTQPTPPPTPPNPFPQPEPSSPTPEPGPIGPGSVVRGWQIVSELNPSRPISGYATLWRTRRIGDPSDTDGRYVLKIFPLTTELAEIEHAAVTSLKTQPSSAAIADIYDVGELLVAGISHGFFVTDHYSDGTLYDQYNGRHERDLVFFLKLASEILLGLQWASRCFTTGPTLLGAHNDIKPQNVALVRRGDSVSIKLLDWGLSRTKQGGTPYWAAPERWRKDEEHAGQLGEIYGVAAILYWGITGRPPLADLLPTLPDGKDKWLLLAHPRPATPVRDRLMDPERLPKEVADLIDRWLNVSPEARLQHLTGGPVPAQDLPQALQLAREELKRLLAHLSERGIDRLMVGPAYAKPITPPHTSSMGGSQ